MPRGGQDRAELLEDAASLREQGSPGRRQDDAAPGSRKKRCTKCGFQRLDGLREWRLCHVQADGGAAKVAFLGYGYEIPQLPQFYIHMQFVLIGKESYI